MRRPHLKKRNMHRGHVRLSMEQWARTHSLTLNASVFWGHFHPAFQMFFRSVLFTRDTDS
jgi:hypothetical protein